MPTSSSEPSNHRDDHGIEIWAAGLRSASPERQAETLRRIAAEESVGGVAARTVELAGSRDEDVRMWAAEARAFPRTLGAGSTPTTEATFGQRASIRVSTPVPQPTSST